MIIRAATLDDIPMIRSMAEVVFRRTYADILSPGQMEYMMDWMYSVPCLTSQISDDGRFFFVAEEKGTPAGYVSFENEGLLADGRRLYHLQKLYVMPDFQKTGLGRRLLEHVKASLSALEPAGCRVELNVNRGNPAVGFYEHMGMHRDRQGDFPIGRGFYMNDYIYAFDVPACGIS